MCTTSRYLGYKNLLKRTSLNYRWAIGHKAGAMTRMFEGQGMSPSITYALHPLLINVGGESAVAIGIQHGT